MGVPVSKHARGGFAVFGERDEATINTCNTLCRGSRFNIEGQEEQESSLDLDGYCLLVILKPFSSLLNAIAANNVCNTVIIVGEIKSDLTVTFPKQAIDLLQEDSVESALKRAYLKKRCIVLLTGGERFISAQKRGEIKVSFSDWCKQKEEEDFQILFRAVKKRFLLFNKAEKETNLNKQLYGLSYISNFMATVETYLPEAEIKTHFLERGLVEFKERVREKLSTLEREVETKSEETRKLLQDFLHWAESEESNGNERSQEKLAPQESEESKGNENEESQEKLPLSESERKTHFLERGLVEFKERVREKLSTLEREVETKSEETGKKLQDFLHWAESEESNGNERSQEKLAPQESEESKGNENEESQEKLPLSESERSQRNENEESQEKLPLSESERSQRNENEESQEKLPLSESERSQRNENEESELFEEMLRQNLEMIEKNVTESLAGREIERPAPRTSFWDRMSSFHRLQAVRQVGLFLLILILALILLSPLVSRPQPKNLQPAGEGKRLGKLDNDLDLRSYTDNKLLLTAARVEKIEKELNGLKINRKRAEKDGLDSGSISQMRQEMEEKFAKLGEQFQSETAELGDKIRNNSIGPTQVWDMIQSLPVSLPLILMLTLVLSLLLPVRLPVPHASLVATMLVALMVLQLLLLLVLLGV